MLMVQQYVCQCVVIFQWWLHTLAMFVFHLCNSSTSFSMLTRIIYGTYVVRHGCISHTVVAYRSLEPVGLSLAVATYTTAKCDRFKLQMKKLIPVIIDLSPCAIICTRRHIKTCMRWIMQAFKSAMSTVNSIQTFKQVTIKCHTPLNLFGRLLLWTLSN